MRLKFSDFRDDEGIARKDGFENAAQMKEWFEKRYNPRPDDPFDIMRW